jgi:hypothetical protein
LPQFCVKLHRISLCTYSLCFIKNLFRFSRLAGRLEFFVFLQKMRDRKRTLVACEASRKWIAIIDVWLKIFDKSPALAALGSKSFLAGPEEKKMCFKKRTVHVKGVSSLRILRNLKSVFFYNMLMIIYVDKNNRKVVFFGTGNVVKKVKARVKI